MTRETTRRWRERAKSRDSGFLFHSLSLGSLRSFTLYPHPLRVVSSLVSLTPSNEVRVKRVKETRDEGAGKIRTFPKDSL